MPTPRWCTVHSVTKWVGKYEPKSSTMTATCNYSLRCVRRINMKEAIPFQDVSSNECPKRKCFPPEKKKKSTAGRQPYQHSKKTTKKKSKSNRQDIPGADTATASKDGRRRDKANYNRREEIKGYSPKRYHSRTHVTDKESLKGKEQT